MLSMKNTKLKTTLYIAVMVLLVVAEALTAAIVLRLGMLPQNYVIIFGVVLVLIASLVGLMMFLPGKKKKISNARRIVACVLAFLMVCGCAVVSKIASDAYRAIDKVTQSGQEVNMRNMYVLVLTDDAAQTLVDTAEYNFGYVENYNLEQTEQALSVIETTIGKTPLLTNYVTAAEVAEALLNSDVNAALMNGISITLLLEEEKFEDFMDKVRIVETIPYVKDDDNSQTEPEVVGEITEEPFIVYVSGSDTRSQILNISRSDVNILMVVNPVSKQVLLVNTPRDYYIPNPAGDGALDKLTHCGLYGVKCSMEALGGLYGVNINYYGQVNFTGFEKLVDAVGGITVYADQGFTALGGVYIQKGENNLNGAQALSFARERYRVSGGDNGRGKNQMKVITAIVNKLTSGTTIISKYSSILESMSGMFTTNISTEEIGDLVKMQLGDMAKWNIQSYAVTGRGGSQKTYSMPGSNAYVMYPDEETVDHASALIEAVLAGDVITEEDVKP